MDANLLKQLPPIIIWLPPPSWAAPHISCVATQLQSSSQSRLISPPISDLAPNLGHFPPNPLPGKSARCVCKHITQNSPTGEQREKGAKTRAAHLLHVFAKLSPYTPAKPSIFPGYQSFFPTLCIFTHNVRYLSFELLASVSSNGSVSPSRPFKLSISENPSECLDPDTGLNHTLGVAWNIPGVCGQAHCELRNQQVYISYAL